MGKPEGKRPVAKRSRRSEDNITLYLQEVGGLGMHWIDLA